jgi:uncharacterized protein (DUF362 family)
MRRFSRLPFSFSRRTFCKIATSGGIATALSPWLRLSSFGQEKPPAKPATNGSDALKHPRTSTSMPGRFPGKVVWSQDDKSVANNVPETKALERMLQRSMLALTGASTVEDAWGMFVQPGKVIGLKVNPVAGKLLSTSPEIVHVIISQLEKAGISRKDIVLWDRREFELHEVGFTADNFPGVRIVGTECKDDKGSFYDAAGRLYGEERIDKDWYYWADVEDHYDAETLPYMINEGKYSYFSRLCTRDVDTIINIPILKNAGPTVTLCMKNLAFGAISNTQRLHKQLWAETCAEVPAFPPLRDKVVLNIVDGIRGCYNGGPAANAQFIKEYNLLLVGTDPVAVDRIGYEIILKDRLEKKVQKEESPRGRAFMDMSEKLGLGVAERDKIELERITLS